MSDLAEQLAELANNEAAPRQRVRATAQGLTFGGADEAEAFLRSQLMGEDYESALADVRGKLKAYQDDRPLEALGFEMGGMTLPAILGAVAGGAGTAAATGRALPLITRLAKIGATEGSIYGFLSGEGGASNRTVSAGTGAIGGAVGGPAGYFAARGIGGAMTGLMDTARRQFGDRASSAVEAEIKRMADEAGVSVDEIADGIASGRIMIEQMPNGNRTLAQVARAFRSSAQGVNPIFEESLERRSPQLRKETMAYLQERMAPGSDNITRQAMETETARKQAESTQYNRIFDTAAPLPEEAVTQTGEALRRVPAARRDVEDIYRAETGASPFFQVDDGGDVLFPRPPTLREAEITRRGVQSVADQKFRTGAGPVATSVKGVENQLRQVINEASPELAATRQRWADVEATAEAFDTGRKALSRSAEDIELEFEKIVASGDDRRVQAYRSGVMAAIKAKGQTGQKASLMRLLGDEERKEGAIFRTVFPGDDLPKALDMLDIAQNSQEAKNIILGGSATQPGQGFASRVGADGLMADAVEASSGSPLAILRTARSVVRMTRPQLSDADAQRVAQLMVEENPEAFRRAMTDQRAIDQLVPLAEKAVERLSVGTMAGGTVAGAQGGAAFGGLLTR